MTHTKGPWWVEKRKDNHSPQIQAAHRGPGSSYCVATVNFWESPEANANLIAAAPDLLESLVSLNAALAAINVGAPLPAEQVAEYQRQADAAIAKTTGAVT